MFMLDYFLIVMITAGLSELLRRTFLLNKIFIPPLNFCVAMLLNIAYFQTPSCAAGLLTGLAATGLCGGAVLLFRFKFFRNAVM